jgi:hypothetical protein
MGHYRWNTKDEITVVLWAKFGQEKRFFMTALRLVQPRPKTILLSELLEWLSSKRAVTAISIESQFQVGFITSKAILEGLIALRILRRGTFFYPVNQEVLAWNEKLEVAEEESFRQLT